MNEGLYVCRPHLSVYVFRVTRLKINEQRYIMLGISFMSNLDALGPPWRFDLRRFALVILVLFIGCACLAILRPFLASITGLRSSHMGVGRCIGWSIGGSAAFKTQPRFA